MSDSIYTGFLERQCRELEEFCNSSSRLNFKLVQVDHSLPPSLFMIQMTCAYLVDEGNDVHPSDEPCLFAIQMPHDYLRRPNPNPGQILNLISPRNCFHPNIKWPFICSGSIAPGTEVVDLVMRVFDLLTYNQFTPREDDCMNPKACRWARAHMSNFPLESRPLRDLHLPGQAPAVNKATAADKNHAPVEQTPTDFGRTLVPDFVLEAEEPSS